MDERQCKIDVDKLAVRTRLWAGSVRVYDAAQRRHYIHRTKVEVRPVCLAGIAAENGEGVLDDPETTNEEESEKRRHSTV